MCMQGGRFFPDQSINPFGCFIWPGHALMANGVFNIYTGFQVDAGFGHDSRSTTDNGFENRSKKKKSRAG